jgi:hypothetical protein
MTTYREIHGRSIKSVSTDPTGEITEGEIWYNATSETFKSVILNEAWSSGGLVLNKRFGCGAADQGPQTASLIFGGYTPSFTSSTEEYNGTGFSTGGALPAAVADNKGCGTQTAALSFMGLSNPSTHIAESFEYDGSTWGSETDLNTARYDGGGNGTQTAGLGFGGYTTTSVGNTEEYDGSSWTNVNSMSTARYSFGHAGVQTSAIAVTGVTPPGRVNSVEEYDGTNWTAGTNYPATLGGLRGFGATNTAAVFAGGTSSPPTLVTTCNSYDGTSFSTIPALGDSASAGATGGSSTAGLYMSGIRTAPGTSKASTEEYNRSANVITGAAWSNGGALPTGVYFSGGSGDKDGALSIAGSRFTPPAGVNTVNSYDGSSWTSSPTLNYSARGTNMSGGPQTASWVGGGAFPSYPTILNNFSTWDNSSWTAGPTLATGTSDAGGTGPQTACLGYGGYVASPSAGSINVSQEYNGSSWSNVNNMPVVASNTGDIGQAQTAAGATIPGGSTFLEYDGTNWTTGPSTPGDAFSSVGGGPLTNSIIAADIGARYDGTSWAADARLATPRTSSSGGKMGDGTTGIVFGGSPPGTLTEEYTGGTSTLNVKTLTQS